MEKIHYEKLLEAIEKGELYNYIVGDLKYKFPTDRNFDLRNDYKQLVANLNIYGSEHPEFIKQLCDTLKEVLIEGKLINVYSVANIIKHQIQLEKNGTNKITFIDSELLDLLKKIISTRKEEFTNLKRHEAAYYENGMYGVYENWNEEIFKHTGKSIL